jgi:hypothetical protein
MLSKANEKIPDTASLATSSVTTGSQQRRTSRDKISNVKWRTYNSAH